MAGWLTNGFQNIATWWGGEAFPLDTRQSGGIQPASVKAGIIELATATLLFGNFSSKTTVSGTRYYRGIDVQAANPTAGDGGAVQAAPVAKITGVQVLVGSVGGTDSWIVELHDSTGVLVATSATAGTTAGTAGTWQQIAFTSPVTLSPGAYYIAVQSNGTTAHPAVYNFPVPVAQTQSIMNTGSVTGVFGTSANFTPATTYTAALGPVTLLY